MNLLHLEDNEDDALLVEYSIRHEWPDCRITRSCTRTEFQAALDVEKYDLVLSDYSMPGFDGISALDMVRDRSPETPFIFLSGTLGEERAIDALKRGATDYLLKGSSARLIPAIRSALNASEQQAAKKRAEEQLSQSRERVHEQASLLGKARDAISVMGLDYVITYWNPSAEKIYGIPGAEAMGRDMRALLFTGHDTHFDTAFALTLALGEWHGEFHLHSAAGSELVVNSTWSLVNDMVGRPKSILCIDTDITARKQLERELQRSQRIESIGMLAGGIAHDLNNILSPILMGVGLLRPLAVTKNDRVLLDTLEKSASHGAELVQQILLFARGGEGLRAELDLGGVLDESSGFLRTVLRKNIGLHVEHEPNLSPIQADATQLKQVIVNLCVNARDAMPKGGNVRISAANKRILPGTHGFHGEIPAGSYVCLSIADTGTGIPPEVLEKIFDPFFTTKEVGKGTGLGLSSIMGIVKSHEGAIQVESTSGRGTAFHIYLPAATAHPEALSSAPAMEEPAGHGESILIIDDDDGVRYVAEKILATQGYDICTACDGESGLAEFHRHRDRFKVVICDQMMPGLSGDTVLGRIHREAPEVKLIAMSGLHRDLADSALGTDKAVTILPKPLQMDTLLRTVRHAIDNMAA